MVNEGYVDWVVETPKPLRRGFGGVKGSLTMTYFRTGNPYYHRRAAVSRSCSGWEGVGPAGYGRQALNGSRGGGCALAQVLRGSRRREEVKLGWL